MNREQQWDNLFPAACAVASSIERFDRDSDELALEQLKENCRMLKRVVDAICPTDNEDPS